MNAVKQQNKQLSLRKSLQYTGVSKMYYAPHPRDVSLNPNVVKAVKRISIQRPIYETRRMAAQIKRALFCSLQHITV